MTGRIKRDGIESYLPTLCLPARKHVAVLEGIPHHLPHQEAARKWTLEKASHDESYFLAYCSDANEITFEWHRPSQELVSRLIKY